jgi:hypothetical protein
MIATSTDISVRPAPPAVNDSKQSSAGVGGTVNQSRGRSSSGANAVRTDIAAASPNPSAQAPTYSKDDRDVTPPAPIISRLVAGLQPTSPGVRLDALTIAVVVNPDGTVDSVRGLVAPENMSETLLLTQALSIVKSWRFSPATRDGAPVKYRQVIPVSALTRETP